MPLATIPPMPCRRVLSVSAVALALSVLMPNVSGRAVAGPDDPLRVTHVTARPPGGRDTLTKVGLGDLITIRVTNLPRLLELAGHRDSIALYLSGIPIDGVAPISVDTTAQEVTFHL